MAQNKSPETSLELSEEKVQWFWGWILHEDNLFANRTNFFMVAESMLFAGFAALLGNTDEAREVVLAVINVAGIIFALVWFYTAQLQIIGTMRPIKKILRDHILEYAIITRGRYKFPGANVMLGGIFPIALFTIWVFLLFAY